MSSNNNLEKIAIVSLETGVKVPISIRKNSASTKKHRGLMIPVVRIEIFQAFSGLLVLP